MEINMERLKNQMTEVVSDLFGRFEGRECVLYDRKYHGDVDVFSWHTKVSLLNKIKIVDNQLYFYFGSQGRINSCEVDFDKLVALEIYHATKEHDFIRFYRDVDGKPKWVGVEYYYDETSYVLEFLDILYSAIELWVSKRKKLSIVDCSKNQSRRLTVAGGALEKRYF